MKTYFKRGLSLLLVLMMMVSMTITASAASKSYTYNWGTRGETATVLSAAAEKFYADNNTGYDALSALSGAENVNNVPSSELYKALQKLMKENHSYTTSYADNKTMMAYTDCQNGGGKISSFYSGAEIGPSWDGTWNREHTWPNSKGLGGSDEDDIMMLRPTATATSENGSRSNKAYGESSGYYYPNSASNGAYDLRGDVARIVLYVYVRWGNTHFMWGTSGVIESKEVLLDWMEADPVDTWELGRNDSVESITGTRNVFVDYPELAFTLFGEDVPTDMITPSGEAAEGSGYTITARSNDTAMGTVSVSGKVINAEAAEGYEVSGYEVVSGSATVVRNGSILVVNAESDCTIRVSFAPKANNAVCFWENGTMTSGYSVLDDATITLPSATATPEDYTFLGWSTTERSASDTVPAGVLKAGSSYTVEENTNLYAVYSYVEAGGESYLLVTDASQLYVGAQVVIASSDPNHEIAMSTSKGSSNNNRGIATIEKNADNTITLSESVAELLLREGAVSGTYAFYCPVNEGYLFAASSSSNHLKIKNSLDEYGSFTITVLGDGTCTAVSEQSNCNNLRYNSSNQIFSCYNISKSQQTMISLYVKTAGNATYYTTGSSPACNHSSAEMKAEVLSDCVNSGTEAGLYCPDCQKFVFGGEEIPATGHFPVTVTGYDPTCTDTGLTDGVQCCVCLYWEEPRTEIPATGHTAVTDAAVAPTCTETGLTEGSHCSVCGATIVAQQTVEATGHTAVTDAAVAPTCTETGLTEGSHCSVCGDIIVAQQTVEATGHSYEEGKCTVCGEADPDYEAPVEDETDKTPDTGDLAPVLAVVILAAVAAAAFVVLAKKRRA